MIKTKKKIGLALFLLLFIFSSVGYAQSDERYYYLTSNNQGTFYIDAIALKNSILAHENPLNVWLKVVLVNEYKSKMENSTPGLSNYNWYVLEHILLTKEQFTLVAYYIYSDYGEQLDSYKIPNPQWQDNIPSSMAGQIAQTIFEFINKMENAK